MTDFTCDLVVLVADTDMKCAVSALLSSRAPSLGIKRDIKFEIFGNPGRDPDCLRKSHDYLRPFVNSHARALVLFDRQGCGQEKKSRQDLEMQVTRLLSSSGWEDRAEAVVLDPELEVWVWSDSPHVKRILGWEGRSPDLRNWLNGQGLWDQGRPKPHDPKKSVEQALRAARKPRSASLYKKLAENVSFKSCADPALEKFQAVLRQWFPPSS